ncbi:MAG: T9SS type A sorting domain-containing protein [Bacteroidia bacterium]|nr:T9SS type A sorting domain-containing protein [Bacteroidia bacterium]
MKNIILLFCSAGVLASAQAQQFSFQMYFTDAIGNKDTLTLGYDLLATDSIDTMLGESNIITKPIDSGLDVRITDEWKNRERLNKPGTFHTKKQFVFYNCSTDYYNRVQTIDIHTKHWPVTATWDSSLFADTCRNGSVFTSINPGGWWDTGSPSDLWLKVLLLHDSVTFTSNIKEGFNSFYGYINGIDTIPVFWQTIGDKSIINTSVSYISKTENTLKVFPNPTADNFSIQIPEQFGIVASIQLFSSTSQLVLTTKNTKDINISMLANGLYLVVITNEKGNKQWTRTIKE